MAPPARSFVRFTSPFTSTSIRASRHTSIKQPWHRVRGRRYASGSSSFASTFAGDLPWAIGSTVVTVPAIWYLIANAPEPIGDHHGDGEHGGKTQEDYEKSLDEAAGNSGSNTEDHEGENATQAEHAIEEGGEKAEGDDTQSKDEEASESDKSSDSASDSTDVTEHDAPETSKEEEPKDTPREVDSGSKVEGVQFKGATRHGEVGDTRKHIPDAKGGAKKRIESDYGMRQGVNEEDDDRKGEKTPAIDPAAASKAPGSQLSQSGRQAGLSNTDTKHSTDITNNPEKSTKSEGAPETAKLQGTVDPRRPQK